MTDRRTESRYPISAAVHGWSTNLDCFEGHTRDISPRGVYIVSKSPIKAGECFAFFIALPLFPADEKATPLWAFCRVVRVEPSGPANSFGIAAAVEEFIMPTRGLGAILLPLQAAA